MTDLETGASHPMEFLLQEDISLPRAGEIRTGFVVDHRNNEILVDIGAKSEGVIESREVSNLGQDALASLAIGNEVNIYVVNPEDQNGNIILSYAKAVEEKDWVRASALMESGDICETTIVGFNRGGILVDLGQLRGFVPNSQLRRDRTLGRDQQTRQRAFQALVNQKIKAKVIEVDRDRNRLILSERAARKEIREAQKSEILENAQVGDVFEGHVVNLADFGAFVDIGGIEGLVHLSELSWKRVSNPADILQVGDQVQVSVLNIDHERQRIALSMKRLEDDPWTRIDETYSVGQLLEATITRLTKFGAFARLNDDYQLEGLIHISELSDDRVEHPREVVKSGDKVTIRIIRIDPKQRQLGLSLKEVTSDKYLESDLALLEST